MLLLILVLLIISIIVLKRGKLTKPTEKIYPNGRSRRISINKQTIYKLNVLGFVAVIIIICNLFPLSGTTTGFRVEPITKVSGYGQWRFNSKNNDHFFVKTAHTSYSTDKDRLTVNVVGKTTSKKFTNVVTSLVTTQYRLKTFLPVFEKENVYKRPTAWIAPEKLKSTITWR